MIALLQGSLIEVEAGRLVVNAAGVGYEVFVPRMADAELPAAGETLKLHIRLIWRDDGPALYGFTAPWDKKLFDLLLSVTGVGPKVALQLLGSIGAEALAQSIALGDSRRLQGVPGIGDKIARRIVLELADKLAEAAFARKVDAAAVGGSPDQAIADATEALVTMGFKHAEARAAVDSARSELPAETTIEGIIREALKRVKTRA